MELTSDSKLTPQLALFLVHDLLLSKKAADDTSAKISDVSGIAASARHPLRLTIEKYKARLRAEFTKSRIKRGYASVKELRAAVDAGIDRLTASADNGHVKNSDSINVLGPRSIGKGHPISRHQGHPRWVRVNALKSTLEEQLRTTFAAYTMTDTLGEVMSAPPTAKVLKIDELLPDLLALPPNHELLSKEAYTQGRLIIQDKASCFPALLLLSKRANQYGDIIDACAAPGNKTTHLAALMQSIQQQLRGDKTQLLTERETKKVGKIFAFERDPKRTITLRKMVSWAGAGRHVTIKGGTDFLKVNPKDKAFTRVKAILLDPSCSGSGIVGRDDDEEPEMKMVLPGNIEDLDRGGKLYTRVREDILSTETYSSIDNTQNLQPLYNRRLHARKKRKLNHMDSREKNDTTITAAQATNEGHKEDLTDPSNHRRLRSLSAFQLSLLRHAMRFPSADRIVYSTCSIHWEENEGVVRRALQLYECQRGGWEIQMRDDEQSVLKAWKGRGLRIHEDDCKKNRVQGDNWNDRFGDEDSGGNARLEDAIADACIRCMKDDGQGTMGFFVVAFVRHDIGHEGQGEREQAGEDNSNEDSDMNRDDEEEWVGFGDT